FAKHMSHPIGPTKRKFDNLQTIKKRLLLMKNMTSVLLFVVSIGVFGCNKNTSGGPGAALPAAEQSKVGMTTDTFSLDPPMMSTKLAQGEAKAISIGIKRGKNID